MQQAYEDRISALRGQVDRITSRQLLDQRLMETRVSELIQRQSQLTRRHGRLSPIIERAEGDLLPAATQPVGAKDDRRAEATTGKTAAPQKAALAGALDVSYWSTRSADAGPLSDADRADQVFAAINKSLRTIEDEQISRVVTLAEDADRTA